MNSPYYYRLKKIGKDQAVVIHRADAPELTGTLINIGQGGCTVQQPGSKDESVLKVFVAYPDIRGVGQEGWDVEK